MKIELYYTINVVATEGEDIGTEYTQTSDTVATAITNENGVAEFVSTSKEENLEANEFNIVEGATYHARYESVPERYEAVTEQDESGFYSVPTYTFDNDRKTTITLNYKPNIFRPANTPAHPYVAEYYVDETTHEGVVKDPVKSVDTQVKAGLFNYFYFSPYKPSKTVNTGDINPYTGEKIGNNDEDLAKKVTDKIVDEARKAASGIYELSITANPSSANAKLQLFTGNSGYTATNEKGEPTALITGSTITITKDQTSEHNYFYVTAEADCTVTITVTKTGDVTEQSEETEKIPVYANLNDSKRFPKGEELTVVPVDGTATAVYNPEDGFYHLNSADGRIICVMLNDNYLVEDRVGEAIANWNANINIDGSNHYIYTDKEENKSYDYSPMIESYVSPYFGVVNDDGVYGLNQDLYDFLHKFAGGFWNVNEQDPTAVASEENRWLLACVYYAQDPVYPELAVGSNEVEFEGNLDFNAYMTFTPAANGWFKFENADEEIAEILVNGKSVYLDGTATPFEVVANTKYTVEILFGYNAIVKTYPLTLSPTEEPKFNVGENEISFGGENVVSMSFAGTDGTYTIQLGGVGVMYLQNNVTVTIGEGADATVVTLTPDSTPRFTATGVQLSAGVKITVSCPDYMGFAPTISAVLTITAE